MRYAVLGTASRLVATIAAAGVVALAVLYFAQERLIFLGEPLPDDYRFRLDLQGGQRVEEVRIPVERGELHALHFRVPDAHGLVFYLHGNAGNLVSWTTGVDFYRRAGWDLFMIDYRGYGKSRGHIDSEAQLHADVRGAWDAVAGQYRGRPLVVFGRSLGTGLAVRLARDVRPDLLVLVSAYTSMVDVAAQAYPLAPAWLLKYQLRSDRLMPELAVPVLLLHGAEDTVIAPAHGRRLQALARGAAELVEVAGAGHNDIHEFPEYLAAYARRLAALAAAPGRTADEFKRYQSAS